MKSNIKYINALKGICGVALLAFLFISCEGPEGPRGASGAAGLQGPQGPEGPTGPVGNVGQPGVANVTAYPWTKNTWTKLADNSTHDSIADPNITATTIREDLVMVYFKTIETAHVQRFPVTFYNTNTFEITFRLDYIIIPGFIHAFHTVPISTSTVADAFPDSMMRHIIIRGGNSARMDYDIDFDDYEAVCRHYGIDP